MLDYPSRLAKARARMAERNIGLLFLPIGSADLFYLTGIHRKENDPIEHNRYGDWMEGAYIGVEQGVVLVAPNLGGAYFQAEAQDKPWLESVLIVRESENPIQIMHSVLGQFPLGGKKVALNDRSWAATMLAFQRALPEAELTLASEVIAPLRMIKENAELNSMKRAGQIAGKAFEHAIARLKPGATELDIASEVDYQLKALGAEYNSFATAVCFSGRNWLSDTKGQATAKKLRLGDSVIFDMGCVFDGYSSDFGRSAFVGDPPAEYVRVHEIVLRAQAEAIKAMKAGEITAARVNAIAREVIEAEGYGPCFVHRLGHGIGITVHEPPILDVVDQSVLQANMTFTVEPSIQVPDRFSNRVEDVVLVTEAGGVHLYDTDRRLYVVG